MLNWKLVKCIHSNSNIWIFWIYLQFGTWNLYTFPTVTELPVINCPDLSRLLSTSPDAATVEFDPSTLYDPQRVNTRGTYYYHGPTGLPTVEFSTNPTLTGPPFTFPVGSTDLTTTISDTELSFQCLSTIVVEGNYLLSACMAILLAPETRQDCMSNPLRTWGWHPGAYTRGGGVKPLPLSFF